MQERSRTSPTALADFQHFVKEGANEIAHHWQTALRATTPVPPTGHVAEPLLLDSVPLVLDEILGFVASDETKVDADKIRRAARPGRGWSREHFDVRELVREYQVLRKYIFRYLNEHAAQLSGLDNEGMTTRFRRAGLAMDEAMRETINAFVEKHTEELREMSRTDSLTGLYNHRTFYERLEEELQRARRYDSSLSIVLIDLDNFKAVNDRMGHQFGDDLLGKCAECLISELRGTDIVCRYGGDEFGVILPETSGAETRLMMIRLTGALKELGSHEGAPPNFGMSFGIGSHPEDDGSVRHIVSVADERLMLEKSQSGDPTMASERTTE